MNSLVHASVSPSSSPQHFAMTCLRSRNVKYIWRPPRFLLRMPTSIASQLAYFASSSILDDVGLLQMKGLSPKEISLELERKGDTYGYGEFIGTDHKAHQGIEK
jgi:hypothetical protein